MKEGVLDDIGMGLQFLEDGDFAHGGRWHSFVLVLQLDLLDRHIVLQDEVARLEDHTVGTLSEPLALLVALLDLNVHLSKQII
jgi:hypothetical protein